MLFCKRILRTYENDIVKKTDMRSMKGRSKVDEPGTKKPSIPYGIGPSKPECGEAEWIEQRN